MGRESINTTVASMQSVSKELQLPRTKVIIRHLPPFIEEKVFHETLSEFLAAADYYQFWNGDTIKYSTEIKRYARAYLRFPTSEHVIAFYKFYDGHSFIDQQGNEYRAIVELAPFQSVPSKKGSIARIDSKENSIFDDENYKKFVENFNAKLNSELTDVKETVQINEVSNNEKTTPLLEYLRERRLREKMTKESGRSKNKGGEGKHRQAKTEGKKRDKKKRTKEQTKLKDTVEIVSSIAGKKSSKRNRDRKKKENKESVQTSNNTVATKTEMKFTILKK